MLSGMDVIIDVVNPVWNYSQAANQYLGITAAVLVMYRLTPMMLEYQRWTDPAALHRMLWFIHIALAGLASSLLAINYRTQGAEPDATSAFRTVLSILAIILCVWWPQEKTYQRKPDRRSD